VKVAIDVSSIVTRNPVRDAHLLSEDFFYVQSHASMRFVSEATGVSAEGDQVRGLLTLRGVARPVVLDVERLGELVDPWGKERIGFRAEARLRRKDFGMTWNQALEAGGVLVGDEVRITLDVQAVADDDE
jgi:polyisoprenoid-binding protein YceI